MLKVARSIYGHDDSDDEDVDEVDHDCGGKGDNGKRLGDYNAYTDIDEVGREFNRRNMLISVVALEQDQRFAVILRGGTSLVYLRREEFQKIVCGSKSLILFQGLFGISIRFLVRLRKLYFDLIIEAVLRFDYVVPQHFSQKSRSCHWKSRRRDPVFRNISTQLLKLKQLPLRVLALAILT
jgi:hypothetical protein